MSKSLVERLQEHERDHRSYHERIDGYHETVAAHKLADDLKEAADRIEELEAERDKWIKKAAAYTANWLNERDHSAKLERVLLDFPTIGKSTADLIKRIKAWLPARAEALAACEEKDDD